MEELRYCYKNAQSLNYFIKSTKRNNLRTQCSVTVLALVRHTITDVRYFVYL